MIQIQEYPVFEQGVFQRHPALFDPYFHNTPEHQRKKYQQARRKLPKYEEKYRWPVIRGAGFCGTTHPGTGKVFHGVMTGSTHPVYNSDCLYVNTARQVFAISDPPGITTFSRDLITRLDELLSSESARNLETFINEINRNAGTGLRDRATLSLIHFPSEYPDKARVLLCGDSHLFQGNFVHRRISRLEAEVSRWGTLNARFRLKTIDISEGDFFVLASDGISAVQSANHNRDLDQTILDMVIDDPEGFALNIARNSNQIVDQEAAGRTRTVFGCGDDLSVVLIDPARLAPSLTSGSYILGGYVEWRTP